MDKIGIVCEYNPFHNGHVYHIDMIKKMYPDCLIVLVMSGNFLERGDVSLINKWDKTKLALFYGVDLVVELPFVFASQGADFFAHGAISILNKLDVDKVVFGSECNDISLLKRLASIQVDNKCYDDLVLKYMDEGINYPSAMSRALYDLSGVVISSPNDILGLCYIKEIMLLNSSIEPVSILRTNDYNCSFVSGSISSARAIRKIIFDGGDISDFVPSYVNLFINREAFLNNYFLLLKYKIMTCDDLIKYETVDVAIMHRLKKYIGECSNLDDFIDKVKTRYYTYNRLKRMFVHILCDFTKEENSLCHDIHYIRVLGFNKRGRDFLNMVKKSCDVPIISNFSGISDIMLDIEFRSTCVYSLIFSNGYDIIRSERNKPIIKDDDFSF